MMSDYNVQETLIAIKRLKNSQKPKNQQQVGKTPGGGAVTRGQTMSKNSARVSQAMSQNRSKAGTTTRGGR